MITAKQLLQDNKKYEENSNLSTNIDIELIMLYFTINKELIAKSTHPLSSIILNKLLTHEYTIDDNHVVGDDFIFSVDSLLTVIKYIEDIRTTKDIKPLPEEDIQVYKIRHNDKDLHYRGLSIKEQREYLERSLDTSQMTENYVNNTRLKFNNIASNTIVDLLSSNPNESKYKDLILSLVNIYPLLYLKELPYEQIPLPKYQICLRTSTYDDENIKGMESRIKHCYHLANSLIKRTNNYGYVYEDGVEYLEFNPSNSPESVSEIIVHNRVKALSAEMNHQAAELFFYKYEDGVYTKNYLEQIIKCIEYNGIEITYLGKEPIVILFYIENKEVKFFTKLYLKTLQKLLPDNILDILEKKQELKKDLPE